MPTSGVCDCKLVRSGRLGRADGRRRPWREAVWEGGRELLDMRACRVQQSRPSASAPRRRDQGAGDKLVFVTRPGARNRAAHIAERARALGFSRAAASSSRSAAADANETRGAHRAEVSESARPRHHARPLDHGASYMDMALSATAARRTRSTPMPGVCAHVPPPYSYRCPFGSTKRA